jgi:serine/threonine-protein kinase
LYQIVSGVVPYGEESDPEVLIQRARQGHVFPIEQAVFGLGVSRRICNIVNKAVAPEPRDRYSSVVALQEDVRAFLIGGLHLPRKVFLPGSLIIQEGDVGDQAYMIVNGKCRAFRKLGDETETLGTMGPGDVFGEMALLLDEPRAASVEALERTSVMVLDKATMTEGLGFGGWTGTLVRALAQRFRNLEQHARDAGLRRS